MEDNTVTLSAKALEEVLTEIEHTFAVQSVPTAQRLRVAALAEELFAALLEAGDGAGQLRWAFPHPGTVELQYGNAGGAPDLRMVRRLNRSSFTDGVNAQFSEGRCVITLG